jgi:hypothetical protein
LTDAAVPLARVGFAIAATTGIGLLASENRQLAIMGGISLACWLTVVTAGRLIAYWWNRWYHAAQPVANTMFPELSQGGYVPRLSTGLSAERLRELARAGAEAILKELRADIIAIERTFPELALPKRRRAVTRSLKAARRRGRQMSAAARKALSMRMKKYWAERRKAKAKVK